MGEKKRKEKKWGNKNKEKKINIKKWKQLLWPLHIASKIMNKSKWVFHY